MKLNRLGGGKLITKTTNSKNKVWIDYELPTLDNNDMEAENNCNKMCKYFSLILRGSITVMEIIIILDLMTYFDLLLAYNYLPVNIITVSIKFLIYSPVYVLWTKRIYRLFGWHYQKSTFLRTLPVKALTAFFIIGTLGIYFWSGFGMCLKGNNMPTFHYKEVTISTAIMRWVMEPTCPADTFKPGHVYATLPENALNGVFINFHLNPEACENIECSPRFKYKAIGSEDEYKYPPIVRSEYRLPYSEYSQRDIFHVLLTDLEPNTTYQFWISEKSWKDKEIDTYSYKTFDINNITILAGGDIGNNELATQMNKNTVSKLNADVILVGGDIAYDNNIPTCYRAWDYLMHDLPHQRKQEDTNSTRLIPVIFAAGNHDLGVNSYGEARILHNKNEPVFKHFFPQNTVNDKVPNIRERKSFFGHHFGDKLFIMSLDAGYEATMEHTQKQWMQRKLEDAPHAIKIAQMHSPILTAGKQDAYFDTLVIEKGKEHWLPIFDQYNMTVVFENHTHSFKRTKRVKEGKEHENGTIYLGEGAWGVNKPSGVCEASNSDITVKSTLEQNVWVLKIDNTNKIQAKAYGISNNVIDEIEFTV